jgi:hypothetical protein
LESNKPANLDNKRKTPSQSKRQLAVFTPPFMPKASSLGAFNTAFDVPKRLLNRGVDISRHVIGILDKSKIARRTAETTSLPISTMAETARDCSAITRRHCPLSSVIVCYREENIMTAAWAH